VFPVAVNVAAQQLRRPEFVDEVVSAMAEVGIGPEGITLELTETVLMDVRATPVVARLRELGIGLALDDFGTGYSSLSYLGRTRSMPSRSMPASWLASSAILGIPPSSPRCSK
jgi:sensor c-di-GMP phosphodiesterase-like protein